METLRKAVIVVAVALGVALVAGYENVPAQKASERVDQSGYEEGPAHQAGEREARTLGQDRVFGKGPVEKAGNNVDRGVDVTRR